MILKFINYKPDQTKFCYVTHIADIEFSHDKVHFRQTHNSKWESVTQGDLKIKILSELDTDKTCPTVLEYASILEIRSILEL